MSLHVDDLKFAGNDRFQKVTEKIQRRFKIGSAQQTEFIHCGIHFKQLEDFSVTLDQQHYIELIKPIYFQKQQHLDWPISDQEISQLRSLLGALTWVATATRPDILVDVSELSGKVRQATYGDVKRANKLLRYLTNTADQRIHYRKIYGPQRVITFADAAFQNRENLASQEGHLIGIAEEIRDGEELIRRCDIALISWKSKVLRRVTRSTFSSELLSQSTAFDGAIWISNILQELNDKHFHVDLKTDCMSLVDSMRSLRLQHTEKRLSGLVMLLREAIQNGDVRSIQHVPTSLMIADGMTKSHPKLKQDILACMKGEIALPTNRDSIYMAKRKKENSTGVKWTNDANSTNQY